MKLYSQALLFVALTYSQKTNPLLRAASCCFFESRIDFNTNVLEKVRTFLQENDPETLPRSVLRNAITEAGNFPKQEDMCLYIAECIQLLERYGFNISEFINYYSDFYQQTTLTYAGIHCDYATFQLLVEKSNTSKIDLSLVVYALAARSEECALLNAEYLAHNKKVNINQIIHEDQPRTVLDQAIFHGNAKFSEMLARYGALSYAQIATRQS